MGQRQSRPESAPELDKERRLLRPITEMPHRELARLYDAHAAALFAFLLQFTRDEADTRDALQEVFRRLAGQPDALHGVGDERRYLLRVAHNLAVDLIRRRNSRSRAHEAHASFLERSLALFTPASDPDATVFQQAISSALAELPPDQRAVIGLKIWEGLTFERIAEVLEIPQNTAASRYRYGMDKLRSRLRPLYDETQPESPSSLGGIDYGSH